MRGGIPLPHILSLQRLGLGPSLSSKESEFPIYAWASDTSAGQVPFTVQLEPA